MIVSDERLFLIQRQDGNLNEFLASLKDNTALYVMNPNEALLLSFNEAKMTIERLPNPYEPNVIVWVGDVFYYSPNRGVKIKPDFRPINGITLYKTAKKFLKKYAQKSGLSYNDLLHNLFHGDNQELKTKVKNALLGYSLITKSRRKYYELVEIEMILGE